MTKLSSVFVCLIIIPFVVFADPIERRPQSEFDVRPPSLWVDGEIGSMRLQRSECRKFSEDKLRQRIVDIALQEWAFFGSRQYRVSTEEEEALPRAQRRLLRPRLDMQESVRLASSIAGYWSATGQGEWIIARQNERWNEQGSAARWRDAWSAAFVSWVMCEAGINSSDNFRFAIAHHAYIDQAIRARDNENVDSFYVAYENGEAPVELGDLLCTGTRPQYLTLSQRRAQMGEGARTHCDIVVDIDAEKNTIDTIGGNVQSAVTLKQHWVSEDGRILSPVDRTGRPVFAHLKFRAN